MYKNKKGFTILELLVVMAIVAILAAIAIPSFIGKIDKTKDAADLAEINAVSKAVAMYYMDNGSYPTLQGVNASLAQPQPVEGSPQNIDFSKIVPEYLAKLPQFSYWWVDYKGAVYHTEKPIGNVTANVFTPTAGYTYTLYKADGSTQVLSGAYTFQKGEYVLGKDNKGRDLPKISGVFRNEKMHPESPEYAGTGTSGTTVSASSDDTAKMLTAEQWSSFDWSKVKAPTGQTSANLGVDSWGNPVNMDLWNVCKITDSLYGSVGKICLNNDQNSWDTGYTGTISGGKIEGCIPAKVKLAGDTTFIDVTSLGSTFKDCTSLTTAPTIPSSVTKLRLTFYGCTNLAIAPILPSGVTDMTYILAYCSSLTTAPVLPSSVTDMTSTFDGCASLTTASVIPSGVKFMNSTFRDCASLTTAPAIPSGVTSMDGCFEGCTKLGK